MIQHRSPISGIATFAPQWIATAGYDNQLILWNAETKKAVARSQHDHLVNACAFSPDGKWLVSASSDHTARIYSVPEMKLMAVCSGHDDDVETAIFNADSTLVATASRDRRIRIFDLQGCLLSVMAGHTADALSVCFESDRVLVSTSDDGTIRKWSNAGEQLELIDLDGVETDALVITLAGLIIAGNDDGEILVLAGGVKRKFSCHLAGIKRLVWDEGSGRMISVSYDRTCKIWNLQGDSQLILTREFSLPNVIWARAVAFNGQNEVVFGTFGSSYATFSLITGEWNLDHVEETLGKNAAVKLGLDLFSIGDAGVLFHNDQPVSRLGSLCNFLLPVHGNILTGGQSGQVFEALSGELIYTSSSPLNCGTQFRHEDKTYAALGTYTGEILIFLVESESAITFVKIIPVHENAIKGIAASDSAIFSVSANREAGCLAIADVFEEISVVTWLVRNEHEKIANGCCYLGGQQFASVSRDLKLRIWDQETKAVEGYRSPHTHSIKCVAANEGGRYIGTGSYNGVIAIFDRDNGSWLPTQRPTACGISSISATANGFAASSYDGVVYEIVIQ